MIKMIDDVQITLTIKGQCFWAVELIQCVLLGENQLRLGVIY